MFSSHLLTLLFYYSTRHTLLLIGVQRQQQPAADRAATDGHVAVKGETPLATTFTDRPMALLLRKEL